MIVSRITLGHSVCVVIEVVSFSVCEVHSSITFSASSLLESAFQLCGVVTENGFREECLLFG